MRTIYLDQNKWIDLAKAIHSPDANPDTRSVAQSLISLVQEGRARFPVSEIHLMEASRIGRRQQRNHLASVLAEFNDGWFLASRQARITHEIRNALSTLLPGDHGPDPAFRPLDRDMFSAFGDYSFLSSLLSTPQDRLRQLSSFLGPRISLLSYLSFADEAERRQAVERMTELNDQLLTRLRDRRARTWREPADLRHRIYSALVFIEIQDKIETALKKMGRTFRDLWALPDEKLSGFVDLIPCLDVERQLALHSEQQWTRELQGNDVYDIAALTGAVPYCDIVVTERFWAHLCKVSGVDKKYRATMLSSLGELHDLLRDTHE